MPRSCQFKVLRGNLQEVRVDGDAISPQQAAEAAQGMGLHPLSPAEVQVCLARFGEGLKACETQPT